MACFVNCADLRENIQVKKKRSGLNYYSNVDILTSFQTIIVLTGVILDAS